MSFVADHDRRPSSNSRRDGKAFDHSCAFGFNC